MVKAFGIVASLILIIGLGASDAIAQGARNLREALIGYQEVPAVSTAARGEFRARISNNDASIEYELSYADLQGDVTQAHIHFGQRDVNGGISVWLCGNPSTTPPVNPPPGTQACPGPRSGTIRGTITASNVVGPAGQGIAAGELTELLRAVRSEVAYVNVHSVMFTGGEIRAQLGRGDNSGRNDDHDHGGW